MAWIPGGNDDDDDPEISHWELMYRDWTGNYETAGFADSAIDDPSDLDEPKEAEAVERTAENLDWPDGEYKMQARYVDGTYGPTEWVIEIGDREEQEEEQDQIDQLTESVEMLAAQVADDGGSPAISDPDEARGAVFSRMLEGDIDPDMAGDLRNFLQEWEKQSRDPVTSPDEFAGKLANAHLASGNTEVATAILDKWMSSQNAAQAGGDNSILSLAQNSDIDDIDMDAIKTLGALRFLDDPRSMIHEAAGGLMDAAEEAPGGQGQGPQGQDQTGGNNPIADALSAGQQAGQQSAESTPQSGGGDGPADESAGDGGDESDASSDESDAVESAADLTVPGMDMDDADEAAAEADSPADPMSAGPEDAPTGGVDATGDELGDDDPVTHSEVEAGPEVADAIENSGHDGVKSNEDGTFTANCPHCGKPFTKDTEKAARSAVNGHKSTCSDRSEVERTEAEIRDEADPENNDYPNAQRAMQDMTDAAEDESGETDADESEVASDA